MRIQKGTKPVSTALSTPLTVWEPYLERIKEFERAMMRHAYEFFAPFAGGRGFESLFKSEHSYVPFPIELRETEEGFVVYAALPGFKENEIEARAQPWRVFVTAKHEEVAEPKKGKPVYGAHTFDQIARWVELPAEINPNKVKATFSKGVLEIALEKAQPAQRIPIEAKAA
jgi:HSP20 family molecular chaperone IbpA